MNKEQSFHNRSIYNITFANLRWLRHFMAKHLAKKYYLSFFKIFVSITKRNLTDSVTVDPNRTHYSDFSLLNGTLTLTLTYIFNRFPFDADPVKTPYT